MKYLFGDLKINPSDRFETLNSYNVFLENDSRINTKGKGDHLAVIIRLLVAAAANSSVYKNRRATILYLMLNRKPKAICSTVVSSKEPALYQGWKKPADSSSISLR